MSLFKVFDIAGSAMSAQSVRLNTTASNLANAETVAASPDEAYRARQPVFAAMLKSLYGGDEASVGVRVAGVVESTAEPQQRYAPDHPMADEEGYIYLSNVNPVDEMVNMISAARSYQNSVEVLNTSKQLMLATLRLGQ
ncbi:MAG TPA: flagellar basal body rod protein FlgC [Thiotrichales bacterium]|nr:flagellar basal body rod protein FlgC [Thiotrichales bacterium]